MTQKFFVIFFDIHGRDLSIEKKVLEDIATLKRFNAATSKGIVVSYVPDYCSEAVAEHILACALWKIRGLREFEKRIEQRYWSA